MNIHSLITKFILTFSLSLHVSAHANSKYTSFESVSAGTRTLLAGAKAYTKEYQQLSSTTQAGIDIATSLARGTNSFAQYTSNNDIKEYLVPNIFWSVYDIAETVKNITALFSTDNCYKQLSNGNSIQTNIRKTSRILASIVEGAAAVIASTYAQEKRSKSLRIRLYTACALAQSIEKTLATETGSKYRLFTGFLALANLALFAHTCLKDFDKEDSAIATNSVAPAPIIRLAKPKSPEFIGKTNSAISRHTA